MRLLASILVIGLTLQAAPQTRTLSGTVVDPAGLPIPGVEIELRQGDSVLRRTVSDGSGDWMIENVAPGEYSIRHRLAGFVTTDLRLTVTTADPVVKVVMKVGAVSETVDVIGATAAPLKEARLVISGSAAGVPGGIVGGVVGGVPAAPPPASAPVPVGGAIGPRGILPDYPRDTSSYAAIEENRFRRVTEHPLSTFSIDVDTASYANVRRFLNLGQLPPRDAVRIEELINYFRFDYPAPKGSAPVSITTEIGTCPWNPNHRLALVGLRSAPVQRDRTPPRNLTFLLDVSGSMTPAPRLPLVKAAMRMLVDTLRPEDRVAIVVYAGSSGVVLPSTSVAEKTKIKQAIEELRAGGSTAGAAGIQLAYDIAAENFDPAGINRVILATDGDFNVGITNPADLKRLIEERRARGIFLSVLGVGDDNLKDSTMEMLADTGNGNYSYLDSIQEARRVLIAEAGSTFVAVAKDVKLQIEFNPRFVGAYRLVGYENRVLRKEDFNNDRRDAGELGAGRTVTALYELVPPGAAAPGADVDPLKYQPEPARPPVAVASDELMTIKVRYKTPTGDTSGLLEFPIRDAAPRTTPNLGFAAAVTEFGMLLRRSDFTGQASWGQAVQLAREHRGRDDDGYRAEFIRLVELAAALDRKHTMTTPDPAR